MGSVAAAPASLSRGLSLPSFTFRPKGKGPGVRRLEPVRLKAWLWPLIVLAIAVPIIAAFALGGPPAGLAAGAIAVTALLVLAARARFDEPIEVPSAPLDRFTLLVVVTIALEDPQVAGAIAEIVATGTKATRPDATQAPEVLLLAPATNTSVAHWLSDLRRARFDAQRRLTLSMATLASVHVDARGEVGDSDIVQAVEDTLRTYPAQEVVFVTPGDDTRDVEQVRRRLDRPVRVVKTPDPTPDPSRLSD
jgi:hypothetical protein